MGKKTLFIKIVIWICVFLMVGSLIGVYITYMFAPKTVDEVEENNVASEVDNGAEDVEILPEIDSENPDGTQAPILMAEEGEVNEMDEIIPVQLENGETEYIRLGDLGDSIQIN